MARNRETVSSPTMMSADGLDAPLRICILLLENLDSSGIQYCHWKSNIRLDKSLAGKTDLDLLTHPGHLARFIDVLNSLGFRPLINPPEKRYDGLSDYLGFDDSTGRLVHIHLHDRLVLGSRTRKIVELPIEELFWRNLERSCGVPVPTPALELMVLLLRAFLKAETSSSAALDRWFPSDILEEIRSLYRVCDKQRFSFFVQQAGLNLDAETLLLFARSVEDGRAEVQQLHALRRQVLAALSAYHSRPAWRDLGHNARHFYFGLRLLKGRVLERRKRLSQTGISIALVGSDGSGKTTLTKALHRWLRWKLIVEQAYLGLPKSSPIYVALRRLEKWFGKRRTAHGDRRVRAYFADLAGATRWLWSAYTRLRIARRVVRLTRRGAIVVCDRYPLSELSDRRFSMDGPRIAHSFPNRFLRLAALEENLYRKIPRPDLVVALRTSLSELHKRKPNLPQETTAQKAALIGRLMPGPGIVIIDNDRPHEAVLRDIQNVIWRRLPRPNHAQELIEFPSSP